MSKQSSSTAENGRQKDAPKVAGRKRNKTQVEPRLCQPAAAGCDIGAREIFVAVPPDRDENPVRKSGTFTWELNAMAEWMVSCGIKTVAMESTGVY